MANMFYYAESFNQNLCPWGSLLPDDPHFFDIFGYTSCPTDAEPDMGANPPGPFCYPCP